MKRSELFQKVREEMKSEAREIRAFKLMRKQEARGDTPLWQIESKILALRSQFRHKHIAICELRGTPRELIEHPNLHNEPSEVAIKSFKDLWLSLIDVEEAVEAHA